MHPQLGEGANATDVRRSLVVELRDRTAVWLRATGFSAERAPDHGAFLKTIERFGLGGERTNIRPTLAVLDWSTIDTCAADGIAMFAVLGQQLATQRTSLLVCGPTMSDLAFILSESGIQASEGWTRWFTAAQTPAKRVRVLGAAAVFGSSLGRGNLSSFLDSLRAGLDDLKVSGDRADFIQALATDMVQNTRAHASGAHACALAVIEPRRRPAWIHLALADSGPGVASHVLQLADHGRLSAFSDFTVVRAVLDQALTSRPNGSGGGFSRLAAEATSQFGGVVRVRTGTALVCLQGSKQPKGARLSSGWGTQILASFPMS